MIPHEDDRPALGPEDETLVRRVADAYRAPAMSAPARRAFDARLDERLARRRSPRLRPWLVLAPAAAVALTWLVLARAPLERTHPDAAAVAAADDSDLEATLVAANDSDSDDALPDDYEAIATFFLGG
jgi:hypothetical protein